MNLAELLGAPAASLPEVGVPVSLLQATVVGAVAANGTVTLRFAAQTTATATAGSAANGYTRIETGSSSTDNISGVRVLAGMSIATGDTVWVLRTGEALLVIGPVRGAIGGGGYFADGLELYHPGSTPYLDFHAAANPAGDANADYAWRLIQESALNMALIHPGGSGFGLGFRFYNDGEFDCNHIGVGGDNADNAGIWCLSGDINVRSQNFVGQGFHGSAYAQFSHWGRRAQQWGYGFLHHTSGECDVASIVTTQYWVDTVLVAEMRNDPSRLGLFTSVDSGNWDDRVLRLHGPTRSGLSAFRTGSGTVVQLVDQTGSGFDVVNFNAGAGLWVRAGSFPIYSGRATKKEIRTLRPAEEADRFGRLNPVRFKRRVGSKINRHIPCDGKGCAQCSAFGTPGFYQTPTIVKNYDSDFLGFIAEEVAEVYPEVVAWDPSDPSDAMSEPVPAGVDLSALTAVLVAEVQDMARRLDRLEKGK